MDTDMDTDGAILITDGATRDITLVGVIQVITLAMATDTITTLTATEEEDLPLTTDQEDILQEAHTIALEEIMLEEEVIPQTEIALQLTDVLITLTLEEALM